MPPTGSPSTCVMLEKGNLNISNALQKLTCLRIARVPAPMSPVPLLPQWCDHPVKYQIYFENSFFITNPSEHVHSHFPVSAPSDSELDDCAFAVLLHTLYADLVGLVPLNPDVKPLLFGFLDVDDPVEVLCRSNLLKTWGQSNESR